MLQRADVVTLHNLASGLALARFEQQPVLSFAEAYAADSPASQQHKRMPQDMLLGAVVKRVLYRRPDAAGIDALVAAALTGIPGPAHLNLALGENAAESTANQPDDQAGLDQLLEAVASATRPVLIVGAAVARLVRDGRAALPGDAVPVFTTAAATGALDERQPAAAGVYTAAGNDLAPERAILPAADCVVAIGLKNLEVLGAKPLGAPAWLVDDVPGHSAGFAAHRDVIVADLARATSAIVDVLRAKAWGLDLVARARGRLQHGLASEQFPPAAAYERLQVLADRLDGRLVTDSGNFTVVAEHVWRTSTPTRFIGSSIGRFMGVALPQAIGAALADPRRAVICTAGDGGLPMFLADARLAVEHRLPILLVLMSDGWFGSMRAKVESRGVTRSGVRVPATAWPAILNAFGWEADHTNTLEGFTRAVAGWSGDSPRFVVASMPPDPDVTSSLVRGLVVGCPERARLVVGADQEGAGAATRAAVSATSLVAVRQSAPVSRNVVQRQMPIVSSASARVVAVGCRVAVTV